MSQKDLQRRAIRNENGRRGRMGKNRSLTNYTRMGATLISIEAHKFALSHDFSDVMWEKAKCRAQESRNWKNHQLCVDLVHVALAIT